MNQLEQLKEFTTVVADTGDFESLEAFSPQDATTNPTLIYKAVQQDKYKPLFEQVVRDNKNAPYSGQAFVDHVLDQLLVAFGCEILKIIPGRMSTEVNASLSFNTQGTIDKARQLIKLYEKKGIDKSSILIKIASTWEGVQAARVLEKEGIHCNMTLLFSLSQAIICAEAGAKLISPFVGRIYDWFKKSTGEEYSGSNDPGVQSVQSIYNYYKKFEYPTEVMGASFRNVSQIIELVGCDLLTISPQLLDELKNTDAPIGRKLSHHSASECNNSKISLDEKAFRWMLNEDAMATEKLAEGIRLFAQDTLKIEKSIEVTLEGLPASAS